MSFKIEMEIDGAWYSNQVRLSDAEQANGYAEEHRRGLRHLSHALGLTRQIGDYHVVEDEAPANYTWTPGASAPEPIEQGASSS